MTGIKVVSFFHACRLVYDYCPDRYARSCAAVGMGMAGSEAKVQAMYILSNLSRWHGIFAQPVKDFLKEFGKE